MMYGRFADPKIDSTFKLVFGQPKNQDITIDFLNTILERPEGKLITEIAFINRENTPLNLADKKTFLDIACTDQNKSQFVIEMQTSPESYFAKRAMYYTSSLYVRQLGETQPYTVLKPVIFLGILTDPFFKNHDKVVTHHLFYDQTKKEQTLDLLELHFVELSKFNKTVDELETKIDKWLFYLKDAVKLSYIPQAYDNCPFIKRAFDVVEKTKWTPEQIDLYERQEMYARSLFTTALAQQAQVEEFKKTQKKMEKTQKKMEQFQKKAEALEKETESLKKEKKQTVYTIACNLLQEGMSIDFVVKATGFSKDEIEKLCKNKKS